MIMINDMNSFAPFPFCYQKDEEEHLMYSRLTFKEENRFANEDNTFMRPKRQSIYRD